MASLLIVGADHLGNIPEHLAGLGVNEVLHMSGRKCQMTRKGIPEKVDAVLVLTDYVNHNLTKVIKQQAKEQDVPIYYAKRSWCSVKQALCSCADTCEWLKTT
ncbi:hypothetical protein PAESOLCIP111_04358 [Paenibacillus solanacearum]|uniref:Dihydroorotate dehydrogenase n=1 Tax=Paenibacillus solanacearum TaxID=2048548 RepID=A0A916NKI3_9BACL|nr:DUF2325 domain-containing protein [Paenibacillus solanacearum]CAG7642584.1 hypothetical protein PAESOLCIP111_04358 [Paenibacillus solanacearum]